MLTYYQVNYTYNFSYYGDALSFSRQINGTIRVKKSWNPLRVFNYIYDSM